MTTGVRRRPAGWRRPSDAAMAASPGRPRREEATAIAAATAASRQRARARAARSAARDGALLRRTAERRGPAAADPVHPLPRLAQRPKERALNLIRDYLLHEYRAKVLKQPVPSAASPGAGPSAAAAARPRAEDLDADEGEAGEEGEERRPPPPAPRRTRVSDRPAAGTAARRTRRSRSRSARRAGRSCRRSSSPAHGERARAAAAQPLRLRRVHAQVHRPGGERHSRRWRELPSTR